MLSLPYIPPDSCSSRRRSNDGSDDTLGVFEFVRMPFGLRNAAQTFERFMDQVIRETTSAYAYIDDVLIARATPEQHLKDVRTVFESLSSHGVILKPTKCQFGVQELDFLGDRINKNGITPLLEM